MKGVLACRFIAVLLLSALILAVHAQVTADEILLKNHRPIVLHTLPRTPVEKARYPVIDMHTHGSYANTPEQVKAWLSVMDETGVEKSIVLTAAHGAEFDRLYELFAPYPARFEVWCGFDYTGYDKPGYGPAAVRELERCFAKGATGVGELGDKGKGLFYCKPEAWGMHPDDPRMDPLFAKCADLGMPVNLHAGEPIWWHAPLDETNDGLMQAYVFKLDKEPVPGQPSIVGHAGMVEILENTVQRHRRTTFIACHFANLSHDLVWLGKVLDRHPNLYVDISAQFAETATIPRHAAQFYKNYSARIVYGTDWKPTSEMNRIAYRILETRDEHFYALGFFNLPLSVGYHWPMYGFGLDKKILKKVYRDNALKILAD